MRTSMKRVGAVGNAFCAFSKDLVGACCASTGPAASTRRMSWSPPPAASRLDAMTAFIEAPQTHGSEMQIPEAVIDGLQSDRFMDQHGADDQHTGLPGDRARRTDASDFIMSGIFHRRQSAWQGPPRCRLQPIPRLPGGSLLWAFLA